MTKTNATDPNEGAPFWWFWLQVPYSWATFNEEAPGVDRPRIGDLWQYGLLCTFLMLAIRGVLHFCLLRPIGRLLRLAERRPKMPGWFAARSMTLAPRLSGRRRPTPEEISEVSAATGLSERSIGNWIRIQRNRDKPTPMARFTECSWYLVYYTTFVTYGFILQWNESYFWDSRHLWLGWPHHHMSREAFWYYMLELGFYSSSLVTLTADIKRKDYLELTIHHLVTVGLIVLSWLFNFTRVGLLTLVIHDAVDPLLAFGKLAKYLGAQRLSDATFGLFLLVWIISRLVALPYRVVYSVYAHSLPALNVPACLVYYLFVVGFVLLQLLHCIWTYYIFRIVVHLLRHGQTDGDIRSDSEMSELELVDETNAPLDGKKDD